jgi:ATP-dependent Clp protease protease subunit
MPAIACLLSVVRLYVFIGVRGTAWCPKLDLTEHTDRAGKHHSFGENRERNFMDSHEPEHEGPIEIAVVGDLTDHESELSDRILSVPPGGSCTLYIDSPGGSPYCAMSLMTMITMRGLDVTAVVTGECSSAALWPFAACRRRIVTPFSVLLFHPMKWQSEEHVGLEEAAEWARHFGTLEQSMDCLLAKMFGISDEKMADWIRPGRYVSGPELAAAGLAELVELDQLGHFRTNGAAPRAKKTRAKKTAAKV